MSGISISFDGLSGEEARYLLDALDHIRGTADHGAGAVAAADQPTYNYMTGNFDAQIPPTHHVGDVPQYGAMRDSAAAVPQAAQSAADVAPGTFADAGVDTVGLTWRADIHSSSKKLAADGSWALRRGYPKTEGDAYKAEFKRRKSLGDTLHATHAPQPTSDYTQGADGSWNLNRTAAPATPSVPDQFGHLGMSPVSAAAPTAAQLNAQFAPHAQPQGATVPPVPQSYAAPTIDYPTWHGLYSRMHAAGKIDEGMYNWMNQQAGVTDINEYYTNATARQMSYGVLQQLELA